MDEDRIAKCGHFDIDNGQQCPVCKRTILRDVQGREIKRPCRSCGHDFDDHDHDEDNSWCIGGLHDGTKRNCQCRHFQESLTKAEWDLLVKLDAREVYKSNEDD